MIIHKICVRSNVVRIGYLENEKEASRESLDIEAETPAQKLKGGVA